jgi:uncharacterized membrane-anchored protein YhcB (DUF1043 family)
MAETWQIIVGIGLFVVGIGVGTLLQPSSKKLKARAEKAEADLADERERFKSHRGEVEQHFEKTSDLFRDMTQQYVSLYSHLAEGARVLAPDRMLEIREGFDLSLLAQGQDAPADASVKEPGDAPVVDLGISGQKSAAAPKSVGGDTKQVVPATKTKPVGDTKPIAPATKPVAGATKPAAKDTKPAAPATKPAAPATKPVAKDTKPAAPATKPAAPGTDAGAQH